MRSRTSIKCAGKEWGECLERGARMGDGFRDGFVGRMWDGFWDGFGDGFGTDFGRIFLSHDSYLNPMGESRRISDGFFRGVKLDVF